MHQPAEIRRQLLRFRSRQQVAEAQRVQKPTVADPVAVVHHLAVQQRDLPGRAAERQQADLCPHPQRLGEGRHPSLGLRRRQAASCAFAPARRRPVMRLADRIARPAIEGVIEAHGGVELCEVVAIHPRKPERSSQQAGGLGCQVECCGIGAAHDQRQSIERVGVQVEFVQHRIESAGRRRGGSRTCPRCRTAWPRSDPRHPRPRTARRTETPRRDRRSGGSATGRRCGRSSAALRVTQTVRPLIVARRDVVRPHQQPFAALQASNPPSRFSAPAPAWRSQAATPWLSFCPRWQTTATDCPVNSPAQDGTRAMIPPDAGRQRTRIRRVVFLGADIDNERCVGRSDETRQLCNGNDVGRGHGVLSCNGSLDAMLRPKPHGAIAVSPLRADLPTLRRMSTT